MDGALLKKTDELAAEWAQNVTTLEELNTMMRSLMKSTTERMLNTEIIVHFGRRTSAASTPSPERQDIFIACVDGLTGFPETIQTAFPQTRVRLCIVHLARAALTYVVDADNREVARDLRNVYLAATVLEAEDELQQLGKKWDSKFRRSQSSEMRNGPTSLRCLTCRPRSAKRRIRRIRLSR